MRGYASEIHRFHFDGWRNKVMVWTRARGGQERKMQAVLEQLKKDQSTKCLKEMIVN